MKRIKRLVVPNGTYQKDGQEKTSWLNIGHILSDGQKTKIKFDCLPVGEFDGWVQVFDLDEEVVVRVNGEERFAGKRYNSYQRVGAQIAEFTNRYLNEKIQVIKSISLGRQTENVQMPSESMPKLREFLLNRLKEVK